YNTVQLMGIAEHPYYGSFGYHVSNFFAPSSRFGTPDELRTLIETAHRMGLCVLMDIVHAHFVANLNEGLWALDGSPDLYNYPEPCGTHPYWGSKMFAFNKNEIRRFLLSNLRYWIEEFGFDGFRFDGVTAMIYFHRGYTDHFGSYQNYFGEGVDEDALIYLRLANDLLRELSERRQAAAQRPVANTPLPLFSIAEEVSGMPGTTVPCAEGGLGFDYRLSMGIPDFWIKLLKERRDENWVMREIWRTLNDRLPDVPQIAYCESHDQALVGDQTLAFRLMGAHMYTEMGVGTASPVVERGLALHKMIRLVSLFAGGGGGGYLNFMGNEFGHPEWIDFPREGNGWSYQYARRQWSLSDRPDLKYRFLLDFDRAMMALAAETDLKTMGFARLLYLHEADKILAFDLCDGRYVFAFNWHVSDSFPDYRLPVFHPGRYRLRLSSDDAAFGGFGRTDAETRYFSQPYAATGAEGVAHATDTAATATPTHTRPADEQAHTAQYLPVYLVHRAAQVWERED
ncbi:MAG: alpha amylase C-terminal domain-containing protein, partial [Bacteroidales bacterium]|nr:alpha amylase C-terminal domain-containing protein [Bacteroidales bacterium]